MSMLNKNCGVVVTPFFNRGARRTFYGIGVGVNVTVRLGVGVGV